MIEMASNYSKTRSLERYLTQWKTEVDPIVPLLKKHANHSNWKVRLIISEITEKLISLTLKNLHFDNFGEGSIGEFVIEHLLSEPDARVREKQAKCLTLLYHKVNDRPSEVSDMITFWRA
jgi:hypothetical protein